MIPVLENNNTSSEQKQEKFWDLKTKKPLEDFRGTKKLGTVVLSLLNFIVLFRYVLKHKKKKLPLEVVKLYNIYVYKIRVC